MSSSQRVSISTTRNKGPSYPTTVVATTLAAVPNVIATATLAQVLGLSTQTVPVAVPALASGAPQDISFSFALRAFPVPFMLATCVLQAQPAEPTTIVALPALSLTFGSGGTSQPGSGVWSFSNLGSYQ